MDPEKQRAPAIRFIVCLGVVSLFADMTYEGAHSIIGPFLKDLGATAAQVGLIAGFGEMLAASLRFFSGRFADRTRAYWTITIFGYALNLIVVPALAFAGNWQMAALLVVAERTGKALRGPARDVLLSEATNVVGHGWGFGLHAAMDQTGAMIGPLLMAVAVARSNQFGPAFLRLGIPAVLALAALLRLARRTPPGAAAVPSERSAAAAATSSGSTWRRPACSPADSWTFRCSAITFRRPACAKPAIDSPAVLRRDGRQRPHGARLRAAVRPLRHCGARRAAF